MPRPVSGFALAEVLVAFVVLALAVAPASVALSVSIRASWMGIARLRVALALADAAGEVSHLAGTGVSCAALRSDSLRVDRITTVWTSTGFPPQLTIFFRTSLRQGALEVADSAVTFVRCV